MWMAAFWPCSNDMTWIILGLGAGIILGIYDFLTKIALRKNGVLEVVFLSSLIGALVWLPFILAPDNAVHALRPVGLAPEGLSLSEHLAVLPKSLMMVVTWVLSYYSVKALPLSISAGIRASGPVWTAIGAYVFLGELLSPMQWTGILLAVAAYYYFSLIGKIEGIHVQSNLWVFCMLAATLMSSANALYDKHILVNLDLDLALVQAYSALQRAALAAIILSFIIKRITLKGLMSENWSITALAIAYVTAEFVYLWSVNSEGALISVISILRRTNLIMVFGLSAILLRENNIPQKTMAIGVVLLGICLVILN